MGSRSPRALAVALALLAASAPAASAARGATFAGTGVWVDVWDDRYHPDPAALVAVARRHRVDAIYVESGNSGRTVDVVDEAALDRLVVLAHRAGIRVVAWYLPDMVDLARDMRRLRAAGRIGVSAQRVDGVGLDIESSAVRDPDERSRRVLRLARRLRAERPRLPVVSIIPSPPGMARLPRYWPRFPYAGLAASTDAFMPMCYASYRDLDAAGTRLYARACVSMIRDATGAPTPVHVVGGIAGDLPPDGQWALANGADDAGATGFSLYDLISMGTASWHAVAHWRALAAR